MRVGTALACVFVVACSASERIARAPATATPAPASAPLRSAAAGEEIRRTLLQAAPLQELPGYEARLYLIEYPPGAEAPLHQHTEQSVGYVLEGRFESTFGSAPTETVHAGQGFVEVPGVPHRFRNPDPDHPLRFVITGTFKKDEALFVPAEGAAAFASPAPVNAASPAPVNAAAPVAEPAAGAPAPLSEVKRTLLVQQAVASSPGLESRLYLMEFPPAARSKPHVHTVVGVGFVLEGSFESSFGEGPKAVKRAGESFVDVTNEPHHFRNADDGRPLRFLFAGTYRAGEPLFRVIDE